MRQALKLHPDSLSPAVSGIEVEVWRDRHCLTLRYLVAGSIADLCLPPAGEPVRAGELWEHTCFEAFVGTEPAYLELNFAPSTSWAAYRFDGYRSGKRDAALRPPEIRTVRAADRFELYAAAQIMKWEGRLGLSAVIEEKGGNKSYWALAHPPGAPDFHHPACFALELPAASTP